MKRFVFDLLAICCVVLLLCGGCSQGETAAGNNMQEHAEQQETTNIRIIVGESELDAVLFNNPTARDFEEMLPLTVALWNPAPNFARAFDLPRRIPRYERPGRTYELGSLAYWYEGPSVAIIYNANREETVVPVVPIGKITGDVSIFFNFEGIITIEKEMQE